VHTAALRAAALRHSTPALQGTHYLNPGRSSPHNLLVLCRQSLLHHHYRIVCIPPHQGAECARLCWCRFSALGCAVYPYDVCRRVWLSGCVRLLCELCAEWQACGYAWGLTAEVSSGGLTGRLCVLGVAWRDFTAAFVPRAFVKAVLAAVFWLCPLWQAVSSWLVCLRCRVLYSCRTARCLEVLSLSVRVCVLRDCGVCMIAHSSNSAGWEGGSLVRQEGGVWSLLGVSYPMLVLSCYTVGPHYCKALRGCVLCMYVGYPLGCTVSGALLGCCGLGLLCYRLGGWVGVREGGRGIWSCCRPAQRLLETVWCVLLWAITIACGWLRASEGVGVAQAGCRCNSSSA
jgi:hypothetical protein